MFKKTATASATGYTLSKSLRFRSSATAYLNRTLTTPTNNQKWTWSGWIKLSGLSEQYFFTASNANGTTNLGCLGINQNSFQYFENVSGTDTVVIRTSNLVRDPSAWYHLVVSFDSTQATASNRVIFYINGVQITSYSIATYPSQNYNSWIDYPVPHYIGDLNYGGSHYPFNGYLTELNFIDGQALTASSFGSFSGTGGVWQPKAYSGTYGTNGFYLPFTSVATTSGSNAGLGKDFSGNSNYFNTNNISVTTGSTYDSMYDVPTLTSSSVANYCTLSPIQSGNTVVDGALKSTVTTNSVLGTLAIESGKCYFEVTIVSAGTDIWLGVIYSFLNLAPSTAAGWGGSSSLSYRQDGSKYGPSGSSSYGASFTTGDVIGVALDMDAGTCTFYKNGTSQGVAFSSGVAGYSWQPQFYCVSASTATFNFGQQPWTYSPPAGYYGVNAYNAIATPTIAQSNKYMDATTFTANGGIQTVTNAGSFQPDFIWTKNRSIVQNHYSVDTNQGINWVLKENSDAVRSSDVNFFTSVTSSGFTLGTSNFANGENIVAWQWQAGLGTITTNNTGNVTANVSVSTTAGFSIATFTTASLGNTCTVGHSLGKKPDLIIYRHYSEVAGWIIYHSSLGATKYLALNDTIAATTNANVWANTEPTSSVFTLGTSPSGSKPTVAYCWTSIPGFSSFGSYSGNNSTDGPVIYCGFRPKWILLKVTTTTENWYLIDSSRDTYNVSGKDLMPNLGNAEATNGGSYSTQLDILSSGFKLRAGGTGSNGSSTGYVYAAFAENPFKYALAR